MLMLAVICALVLCSFFNEPFSVPCVASLENVPPVNKTWSAFLPMGKKNPVIKTWSAFHIMGKKTWALELPCFHLCPTLCLISLTVGTLFSNIERIPSTLQSGCKN